MLPNIMAYYGKWTTFDTVQTKSVVQKRDLESVSEILPVKVEVIPAPVIEHVEEKENEMFQRPEPILNRVPLARSVGPRLYTSIQESIPLTENLNADRILPVPVQQKAISEFYGGLPPRLVEPISAAGPATEKEIVPAQNNPVPEARPTIFDLSNRGEGGSRVRQYAVYAGDVILKYLSQFFNRARLTFNRYTSPLPPTPVYENN